MKDLKVSAFRRAYGAMDIYAIETIERLQRRNRELEKELMEFRRAEATK